MGQMERVGPPPEGRRGISNSALPPHQETIQGSSIRARETSPSALSTRISPASEKARYAGGLLRLPVTLQAAVGICLLANRSTREESVLSRSPGQTRLRWTSVPSPYEKTARSAVAFPLSFPLPAIPGTPKPPRLERLAAGSGKTNPSTAMMLPSTIVMAGVISR